MGPIADKPNFYQRIEDRYPDIFDALERVGAAVRKAGPLDDKTVHLVQLAAAAAARSEGAVHSHVRRALASGASPSEVRHALLAVVSTVGLPTVMAALSWTEEQLDRTAD